MSDQESQGNNQLEGEQDQEENQVVENQEEADEMQENKEGEPTVEEEKEDPYSYKAIEDFQNFHEDCADLIRAFYENSRKVFQMYPKIRINSLTNFKNDVDDVVGLELDELVYFIKHIYQLKLDKVFISFKELYERVLPEWASFSTFMRQEGKDAYYQAQAETESEDDEYYVSQIQFVGQGQNQYLGKDRDLLEVEREKVRGISKEVYQLKIQKHFEKLKDVFRELATKASRDSETPVVKLKRIFRYMDDLAYICGIVVIDYPKYLSNAGNESKSQVEVVNQLQFKLWLETHQDLARQLALKREEERGIRFSILKSGHSDLASRINEEPDVERETLVHFEDQTFSLQREETLFSFDQFVRVLEGLVYEDANVLCVDANHEFEQYFESQWEQERMKEDEGYDPFQNELLQQVEHYERILTESPFKTEKERNIIQKLYEQAKEQLDDYMENKTIVAKYHELKQNKQFVLESMRRRSLQQIFFFYTGQHFKWNLSFDELLEKKFLLDFGEFNIFCKDFGVPLPKSKRQIVFKRCSVNHKPHEFSQFVQAVDMLAAEVNAHRVEEMRKRVLEIGKLQKMRAKQKEKRLQMNKKAEDDKRIEDHLHQLQAKEASVMEEGEEEGEGQEEEQEEEHKEEEEVVQQTQENQEEEPQHDEEEVKSNAESKKFSEFKDQSQVPSEAGLSKTNAATNSSVTQNKQMYKAQLQEFKDSRYQREETKFQGQIHIEKDNLIYEIERLQRKPKEELLSEFYEFLSLYDAKQFRAKLKGLKTNPFNMKDNYQRIREAELQYVYKPKLTAEQIRERVNEMRDRRLKEKRNKELRERRKEEERQKQMKRLAEENRKKNMETEAAKLGMDVETYLKQRNKKMGQPVEEGRNIKVSLDDLSKMTYKDISMNLPDDFKPSDVIRFRRRTADEQNAMMSEIQHIIDGNDPSPDPPQPTVEQQRNFAEKLYAVKKQNQTKEKPKVVINPQLLAQQMPVFVQPPMTERSAIQQSHKRGGNQPLQKVVAVVPVKSHQRGRSTHRGRTPDMKNRSKSKNQSQKSRTQSSPSKSKDKIKPKYKSRAAQSIDHHIKSSKNLAPIALAQLSKHQSGLPKGNYLSVAQSTTSLKGKNNNSNAQSMRSYDNKSGVISNKYKASDILLKAQEQEFKQKRNLDNILRMHDRQIEKGLRSARR